jgi:ABC-type glycerol-3-phosphate transport system substrate-binding protein
MGGDEEGSEGATTDSGESVNLELVWFSGQATEQQLAGFDTAIADFEESTGYTVDVRKSGQVGQIVNQTQSAVQAGEQMNVSTIPAGACQSMIANDFLEPIGDRLSSAATFDQADFTRGKLEIGSRDGSSYAVPIMSGHWGSLFYNPDMLDQAGYDSENPNFTTWSQFLDVAEDVKNEVGVQPVGMAGADHIHNTVQWTGFYMTTGENSWLTEDKSDTLLDQQPGVQTAEFTEAAATRDLLPQGVVNMNASNLRELFINEELFAYQVGGFDNSIIKEQTDMEFGITYNPQAPDGEASGFSGGLFYVIPKGAPNQEETWELIEHLMRLEYLNEYAQLPPIRQNGLQNFFEGTTDGMGRDVSEIFITEIENASFPTIHQNQGQMWSAQRSAIQEIMLGRKTGEESMNDLAGQVRDLL